MKLNFLCELPLCAWLNPSNDITLALLVLYSIFQVHPCLQGIQAGCWYYLTCTDALNIGGGFHNYRTNSMDLGQTVLGQQFRTNSLIYEAQFFVWVTNVCLVKSIKWYHSGSIGYCFFYLLIVTAVNVNVASKTCKPNKQFICPSQNMCPPQ